MSSSIAIIGVSGYAKSVFNSLCSVLNDSGARLVAATVINREEESATCSQISKMGGTIFSDYREMLNSFCGKLDLVLVPTSIHWHAPIVLDALKAGANVLVEKPLTGCLDEAQAVVDGAASAGRFAAVAFQDMYVPQTWEIKRFLVAGKLGRIRSVQLTGSWPRGRDYYFRNRWAGRLHCDGMPVFDSPLHNAFAHFINLALFFAADEVNQVEHVKSVKGQLLRFFPIESFDTAAVSLLTSIGLPIHTILTHADSMWEDPRLVIQMEHGTLNWNLDSSVTATNGNGRVVMEWKLDPIEIKRQVMMRNVLHCVLNRELPLFPADLALNQVEAVEKIHSALPIIDATAQRIELGSDLNGTDPFASVPGIFSLLRRNSSFPD